MRERKRRGPTAGRGLCVLLVGASLATPRIACAALSVTRWTVDGGGTGLVQAGRLVVGATAGQPDAGILGSGSIVLVGGFWATGAGALLGVDDEEAPITEVSPPREAVVLAATPNPLSHGTLLAFELPDERSIDVRIFDVKGALVRTLQAGTLPAGHHAIAWDGADSHGRRVGAGMYLARFRLGTLQRSQELVVLR